MYQLTGLIPLGKTQLSEYGFLPSAEHPRLGAGPHPWSTDHTAGASSAGSAALVAAGVVPIAHANDGGGSIRIPASVNGLVGLKPTRDRLAQDKMMREQPVRIVADGVVTRSVRDTAAFYREAEKIYRNVALPPIGDITRPGRNRLRISVVTAAMGQEATPEVAELTLKVAGLLEELGHTVVEGDVPPLSPAFKDDFLLYWSSLALFLIRNGRRLHGRTWDRTNHDAFTLGLARHATRKMHRLPGAITRLRRTQHLSAEYFQKYDVVLAPTLGAETPLVGHLDPTAGLRGGDGPHARLDLVHAHAERDRRPGDLAAAGHHCRRPADGHDVRGRRGSRGDVAGAGLRARGGIAVRLDHRHCRQARDERSSLHARARGVGAPLAPLAHRGELLRLPAAAAHARAEPARRRRRARHHHR